MTLVMWSFENYASIIRVDPSIQHTSCSDIAVGIAWSMQGSSGSAKASDLEAFVLIANTGILPPYANILHKQRIIAEQLIDQSFQIEAERILSDARISLQRVRNEYQGGRYGDLADRGADVEFLRVPAELVLEKVWQSEDTNGKVTVFKEKASAARIIASIFVVRTMLESRSLSFTHSNGDAAPFYNSFAEQHVAIPLQGPVINSLYKVEYDLLKFFPVLKGD